MRRRQWLRFWLVLTCYRAGRQVPDEEIERDIDFILKGLKR